MRRLCGRTGSRDRLVRRANMSMFSDTHCIHYVPGETLIHTICGNCVTCCKCPRIPTGRELREQADAILDGLWGFNRRYPGRG